jgi:hypothetical protein
MLRRLLSLAAGKGTRRTAEIARELNVSPALVEGLLEESARQGFLKSVVAGCSTPCESCPTEAACLFRSQPRVWALTRKGERMLRSGNGGTPSPRPPDDV